MREIILFLLFGIVSAFACTTAIISGKYTADGRPLLWKHRDSGFEQNKLMYFSGSKYNFIGLINSADSTGKEVWAGVNSEGFAIMNSASYNLKPESDTTRLVDQEGVVMRAALEQCRTLADFEELLEEWPKPIGVESNFGVIDANGGAAYYETGNFAFTKLDANDPKQAPFGYIIHTNYSFTGNDINDGYGYIRYAAANKLFDNAIASGALNASYLLQKCSRSLEHSLTGDNLYQNLPDEDDCNFVFFADYIPRKSSVSTVVVQGVNKDESPSHAIMWTMLGWPLTTVAVPVWVLGGSELPKPLMAPAGEAAALCDLSLQLKAKCFPVKRGSGWKYMDLSVLLNQQNSGYLQKLLPVENEILTEAEHRINTWRRAGISNTEIQKLYRWMEDKISQGILKQMQN